MKYHPITSEVVDRLIQAVGEDFVITGRERTASYLYDEVEITYRPDAAVDSVVVKPADTLSLIHI